MKGGWPRWGFGLALVALVGCAGGADVEPTDAGGGCENSCSTVGERSCYGAGTRRCTADGEGCLGWSDFVPCDVKELCRDGKCVAGTCEDECADGDTVCAGEAAERACGASPGGSCKAFGAPHDCPAGQQCTAGRCSPPACTDECPADGERECLVDSVRLCAEHDGDGCLEWSAPEPCPAEQTCSGGACAGPCTDDCTIDEISCDDEGLRSCGQFDGDACMDWSSAVPCDGGQRCVGDACVEPCADECAVGATRCTAEGQLQQCDGRSELGCRVWGTADACAEAETCPEGANECAPRCPSDCIADRRRCTLEGGVERCTDADGDGCRKWQATSPSAAGSVCEEGSCVITCTDACPTDGAVECADATGLRHCAMGEAGCLIWGPTVPCAADERCSGNSCVVSCTDECPAEESVQCAPADAGLRHCGQHDGDRCLEWSGAEPCPAGQSCSADHCAVNCSDDCAAGAVRCVAEGLQRCGQIDADLCLDWLPAAACRAGEGCVVDRCVVLCSDDCAVGELRCLDETHLQRCGEYDADTCRDWEPAPAVCPDGGACSGGACLPGGPPGVLRIGEIVYDDGGTDGDQIFWNFRDLEGYRSMDSLSRRSMATGEMRFPTSRFPLTGRTMPADGYFVIVHGSANAGLQAQADMTTNSVDFQNGPDSLRLVWGGADRGRRPGLRQRRCLQHRRRARSVAEPPEGSSLSRDTEGTDSDDNRRDFAISTASPGGPRPSDWDQGWLVGPGAAGDAAWPDVVAIPGEVFLVALLRPASRTLSLGLFDAGGELDTDDLVLPSDLAGQSLTYAAPLAVNSVGDWGAALLAATPSAEGPHAVDGLRGSPGRHGTEDCKWMAIGVATHALTAAEQAAGGGTWIRNAGGIGLAHGADGEPRLAWLLVRNGGSATALEVARRHVDGTWSVDPAADDGVGDFALGTVGNALQLYYVAGAAPGGFELRVRTDTGTGFGAPETIQAGLSGPSALRTFVDAGGGAQVCFIEELRRTVDAQGQPVDGAGEVRCATKGASWTVTTLLAASAKLLPGALDAQSGPGGTVAVLRDDLSQGLWYLSPDAGGASWSPALVDFGGWPALWPALALEASGTPHLLHGSAGTAAGLLHSTPKGPVP